MSSKVVDTGSYNSGSCHALGRKKKKLKQIISVAKRQTAAEVTADSWGRVLKKLFLGVGWGLSWPWVVLMLLYY